MMPNFLAPERIQYASIEIIRVPSVDGQQRAYVQALIAERQALLSKATTDRGKLAIQDTIAELYRELDLLEGRP